MSAIALQGVAERVDQIQDCFEGQILSLENRQKLGLNLSAEQLVAINPVQEAKAFKALWIPGKEMVVQQGKATKQEGIANVRLVIRATAQENQPAGQAKILRFKLVEEYIYDHDRLARILAYNETPGILPYKTEERFSYDDRGDLLSIKRFYENGQSQFVYQKKEKGQTFKSIRDAAGQKLVEAVVQRLRDEKIREKLFCIELSYQAVLHHCPPLIFLGREDDRQRLLNSGNPDARYAMFTLR